MLPILLDAALKGVVLLGVVAAVMPLLRRASASTRHIVWFLAVAAVAVLPVLSATLPAWQVLPSWMTLPGVDRGVDRGEDEQTLGATAGLSSSAPIRTSGEPHTAEQASSGTRRLPRSPVPPAAATPASPQKSPSSAAEGEQEESSTAGAASWPTWLLTAWLAGTVVALLPIALGLLSLRWLSRSARQIVDGPWPEETSHLAAELGVRRRIVLLQSRRRSMPMQWGIFRPKLLLPAEADDWSDDRRRVVVLHELAHIRRADCLTQLLSLVACALFWFNLLVWFALRRMRLEREAACDDLILAAGCKPSAYADQLLQIASGLQAHTLAACGAIAMARPSALEGRLLAILDPRRNRRTLNGLTVFGLLGLIAAVVFPLSMVRAVSDGDRADLPLESAEGAVVEVEAADPTGATAELDPAQRGAYEALRKLDARIELRDRRGSNPLVADVVLVHLEKRQLDDDDLTCLVELPNLERLYLADTRATDAAMRYVGRLSKLRRLSLHGTRITDAGLSHLAELTRLEALDVHSTQITDTGLVHLANLGRLKYLNLGHNVRITDRGLVHLRFLGRLGELDLTQTAVSDAGLAQLSAMPALSGVSVKLAGTDVTPDWLGHLLDSDVERVDEPIPGDRIVLLRQLPNLKHVTLCDVTDAQLEPLGQLEQLERIDLSDTQITDAGLVYLERLGDLRSLVLRGTAVTDRGIAPLARLASLESLDVSNTPVSDAGLAPFRGHAQLQWVIAVGTNVTAADVLPGVRVDLTE